jgi:NAD(P)-dependent dehydrogenase (short-subunit alcohol dehydrogenase family)
MNLNGKTIVITGATDGIGKVTARELAKAGAAITIVGRNAAKGERVVKDLRAAAGHDGVDFVQGDLLSLKGVRGAAETLKGRLKGIDVLINNAGAAFIKRGVTEDGVEQTFALNHLGYFLMTALLLDLLKTAPSARVVNVASGAHFGATLDLGDLQNAKSYSGWRAYQQSKLANVYFTYELARRLQGTQVTANCLHPGFVASRFGDNNKGIGAMVFGFIKSIAAISEEDGAKTSIYLAGSPEVAGVSGKYFDKCKPVRSSPVSYDDRVARALWRASETMAGLA